MGVEEKEEAKMGPKPNVFNEPQVSLSLLLVIFN